MNNFATIIINKWDKKEESLYHQKDFGKLKEKWLKEKYSNKIMTLKKVDLAET